MILSLGHNSDRIDFIFDIYLDLSRTRETVMSHCTRDWYY